MAGMFAVIAPTIGPFVGGYLTQTLFLALDFPDQYPAGPAGVPGGGALRAGARAAEISAC